MAESGDIIVSRDTATGFVYQRDERWPARLRRWALRIIGRPERLDYGIAHASQFTMGGETHQGHVVDPTEWRDPSL
jgi:hypothetical protein